MCIRDSRRTDHRALRFGCVERSDSHYVEIRQQGCFHGRQPFVRPLRRPPHQVGCDRSRGAGGLSLQGAVRRKRRADRSARIDRRTAAPQGGQGRRRGSAVVARDQGRPAGRDGTRAARAAPRRARHAARTGRDPALNAGGRRRPDVSFREIFEKKRAGSGAFQFVVSSGVGSGNACRRTRIGGDSGSFCRPEAGPEFADRRKIVTFADSSGELSNNQF